MFFGKKKDEQSIGLGDISQDQKDDIHDENTEENTENAIEQVTSEEAEIKDDTPVVNKSGRDVGNAKNFKMMASVVIGLVIILVGIGLSIGRYQQNQQEAKTKEVEKQAKNQRDMTNSTTVDIEADKRDMLHELPPPADVNTDTAETVETTPTATEQPQPIVKPVEPTPAPQPQYNNYNDSGMVAGRDYAPPAPIPAPAVQPISVYDDPEEDDRPVKVTPAPAVMTVEPKEHTSVLVDVYGAKTVSAVNNQQETGLASSLKSSKLANGSVDKRGNKTMLLMRGTTIPCVLITKIDSTYQGFATCQLTKDVYSANGKVLLMERGSKVFGEQNVQISQGKARVSILWSRVETPKGVAVDLDSPATGQLGEMGIKAKVNNHFWKRFGGAIMLSIIQDASAIGRSHLEKQNDGDNTTNVNNTTNTAEGMAEEILKNTINIPPTATVNQGTVINIMVARDIDFSSIYKVVRR